MESRDLVSMETAHTESFVEESCKSSTAVGGKYTGSADKTEVHQRSTKLVILYSVYES